MYERERRNSIFHSLLPWLLPSGRFRSLGASFTAHSFARIYIYSRRVLLFLSFFFPSTPFLNINLTPKCRNPATLHCVIPRTRGYIKDALLHLFRLHPSILYYTTTTITRSLPSLIPTAQCCKKKNNLVFFFLLLMPLLLASGFNCKPSLLIFHLPTFTISIHHSWFFYYLKCLSYRHTKRVHH